MHFSRTISSLQSSVRGQKIGRSLQVIRASSITKSRQISQERSPNSEAAQVGSWPWPTRLVAEVNGSAHDRSAGSQLPTISRPRAQRMKRFPLSFEANDFIVILEKIQKQRNIGGDRTNLCLGPGLNCYAAGDKLEAESFHLSLLTQSAHATPRLHGTTGRSLGKNDATMSSRLSSPIIMSRGNYLPTLVTPAIADRKCFLTI